MRSQWIIVFGLILATLTASVAIFNVELVTLNYIFGQVDVPLIVVISGSILIGGIIVALFGLIHAYVMRKEADKLIMSNQALLKNNNELKSHIERVENAYAYALQSNHNTEHQSQTLLSFGQAAASKESPKNEGH